jgi:hypothetical protein
MRSNRNERPSEGDLQLTIHGLQGIFWALDMLLVEKLADKIAHEQDIRDGIAGLIVAGERLTEEISSRF